MDLSSDLEERRVALLRAREHSLDIVRVAQVTAEKSVEKAFEVCRQPSKAPFSDNFPFSSSLFLA